MYKEVCHQTGKDITRLQKGSGKYYDDTKLITKVQKRVAQCIHENVSKISLSANGDRRIQTFDGVVSYPCGTSPGRLWKTALMRHQKIKT